MELQQELQERGFIHQTSADISEILSGEKRTIYLGVDPTADSIHAGNFVIFMLLRHLASAGHRIILLAGGGTGRIGDPKPDVERPLVEPEEVNRRVGKLQAQAAQLLDVPDLQIVDNYEWLGQLNLIEFLRDIGKHFTVGELIKKDAIAERLKSETGLSYTEFAYPLLQGYDFLELYRQHGCDVQVGGSDQWGNIVAGVDLVRRKERATAYAITVPLVIDKASGKKFGKSEGNAVWLDAEKTTPYQFYQFWLNASDESVVDYLKLFTFLSLEEIATIETEHQADPGKRVAQKRLASEVTTLVHGDRAATAVKLVTDILFNDVKAVYTKDEQDILLAEAPVFECKESDSLLEVLVKSNLATSNREARTFLECGSVRLLGEVRSLEDQELYPYPGKSKTAVLKRGKKRFVVLHGV